MKLFPIALIVFLQSFTFCFAQDILIKNNGEILKVKVVETDQKEIRYRNFGDANGPLLSIPNIELQKITFENGFVYERSLNSTEVGQSKTRKGNNIVSGSTGAVLLLNADHTGDVTTNSITVTPAFAHFVADNFAIGINGSILYRTVPQTVGSSGETQFLVIPSLVYYFKVAGNARPFIEAGAGLATLHTRHIPTGYNFPDQGYSGPCVYFGFGVSCFIKNDISFDLGMNYTWVKLTNNENKAETGKTGIIGSSLGFSIYF